MNESFLWYLWKYRLYSHALSTTSGEPVAVEHPGFQNSDSGPDFFNARVRIGDTLWAGNVEIHTQAADWHRHGHQYDMAFDSVILHVVYEADAAVIRMNGQEIPVVALKQFIDHSRWEQYKKFIAATDGIPCARLIGSLDHLTLTQWLDRTLVTRMERKSKVLDELLKKTNGNWEEAFYIRLAVNFGFKVNSLPFEMLAGSLPLNFLLKHHSVFQAEALLFGQAGLLAGTFRDQYPRKLKKEYIYLKKKLGLPQAVEPHLWKLSRLRPVNFPFIRIAQFARIWCGAQSPFACLPEAKNIDEVKKLFYADADEYWTTHYRFDRPSPQQSKQLGMDAIENIIINTVAPIIFHYGKARGLDVLCERALKWLEGCSAENNTIIRKWNSLGIKADSAFQSQGLIELRNEYCAAKKCLTCGIGIKLLSSECS